MYKSPILRIALALFLFAASVAAAVCLAVYQLWWAAIIVACVAVFPVRWMLRLPYLFEDKLHFIVAAIHNKDYTFSFNHRNQTDEINQYLNSIRTMLIDARLEVEEKERYLEHVLAHINTGVIVCNQHNSMVRSNEAAKQLLSVSVLEHIHNLDYIHPGISHAFQQTTPSTPQTYLINTEREQVKIHIQVTHWKQAEQALKIYTINNISSPLDQQEVESWTRLTRVLTHEIMNALTPIISLSSSLAKSDQITDPHTQKGLNIIANTGRSLVTFVDNYHRLARLPKPNPTVINLADLLHKCIQLVEGNMPNITTTLHVDPPHLMIHADSQQVQQIILNLLKNAQESIADQPGQISIEATCASNEDILVRISDSGPRIAPEVIDNIFVPFYTTKVNGSGIGLSLARQIMRNHHGSLQFVQNKKVKTFVLTFR